MDPSPGVNCKLLLAEAFERVRRADALVRRADGWKGPLASWRQGQAQRRPPYRQAVDLYLEAVERFLTCGKAPATDSSTKQFCREKATVSLQKAEEVKGRLRLFVAEVDHSPAFEGDGLKLGRAVWGSGIVSLKVGAQWHQLLFLSPGTYCIEARNLDKYPGPSGLAAVVDLSVAMVATKRRLTASNVLPASTSWPWLITIEEADSKGKLDMNVKTDAWIRNLSLEVTVYELERLTTARPEALLPGDAVHAFFESLQKVQEDPPPVPAPIPTLPHPSASDAPSGSDPTAVAQQREELAQLEAEWEAFQAARDESREEDEVYALEAQLQALQVSPDDPSGPPADVFSTLPPPPARPTDPPFPDIDPDDIDFGD